MFHLITFFPFLILGCWVSGFMAVWLDPATIQLTIPKNKGLAWLTAGCLGLILPLGGVGLWPVLRRLYQFGWPPFMVITAGVTAPVLNGLTLLTLWSEGLSSVVGWVLLLTLLPAAGLAWGSQYLNWPRPIYPIELEKTATFTDRLWQTIEVGGDELLDWGRVLIVGAVLSALLLYLGAENWLWVGLNKPLLAPLSVALLAFMQAPGSWVQSADLSLLKQLPAGFLAVYLVVGANFNLMIFLALVLQTLKLKMIKG